jgi:hypothetical protein
LFVFRPGGAQLCRQSWKRCVVGAAVSRALRLTDCLCPQLPHHLASVKEICCVAKLMLQHENDLKKKISSWFNSSLRLCFKFFKLCKSNNFW